MLHRPSLWILLRIFLQRIWAKLIPRKKISSIFAIQQQTRNIILIYIYKISPLRVLSVSSSLWDFMSITGFRVLSVNQWKHHANNQDGEHLKKALIACALFVPRIHRKIRSISTYIYVRSGTPNSSGAKRKITGIEKMLRFHRDFNSDRRIQSPEC